MLLHAEFFQLEEVPNPYSLIETTTSNERVFRVELGAHHVMGVSSENGEGTPILPVPYSHCLVVTGRNNPRQFRMELNCSYIVQVTLQSEHALLDFVVPHLDKVVVASRHEHRLGIVEADSSDRS